MLLNPANKCHDQKSSPHESTEEACCFICQSRFTSKRPGTLIPCSFRCNDTPVHAKCIYEWQHTRVSDLSVKSSCPLCRRSMVPIDYIPPDPLNAPSLVMFQCRKNLVIRPLPRAAGIVKMYIRKYPSRYQLYLQPDSRNAGIPTDPRDDGDIFLLAAVRRPRTFGNTILDITLDQRAKDTNPRGVHLVGSVHSSLMGLTHTVYAPYVHASTSSNTVVHREIAAVRYIQNRVGRNVGPRKMKICIPRVERDDEKTRADTSDDEEEDEDDVFNWNTTIYRPSTYRDTLPQRLKHHTLSEDLVFGFNKQPYWLETIQAYSLDFRGRVTLPSNKNFQLISHTNPVINETSNRLEEKMLLQFGKVQEGRKEIYTMDVQWPLSPVQAFGIAITACERKFGCA